MSEKTRFLCSYCDKYFSEPGKSGCGSCQHHNGCKKIKCPYCGYDNIPDSLEKGWLLKFKQTFLSILGSK